MSDLPHRPAGFNADDLAAWKSHNGTTDQKTKTNRSLPLRILRAARNAARHRAHQRLANRQHEAVAEVLPAMFRYALRPSMHNVFVYGFGSILYFARTIQIAMLRMHTREIQQRQRYCIY